MSKYTTQLRFICETLAGLEESVGLNDVNDVIATARPLLFDNYDIFDPLYKPILETKIIKHFYTREISAETPALWKFWLNNKMNEIMPYYNQLYQSALLEFDPFKDTDYTVEHHGKDSRTGKYDENGAYNDSEISANKKTYKDNVDYDETYKSTLHTDDTISAREYNRYSDTPQGALTNVLNDKYLTDARVIDDNSDEDIDTTKKDTTVGNKDTTGNENINGNKNTQGEKMLEGNTRSDGTDDYLDTIVGKRSGLSYSELLEKYRKTFLNIDMMIIEELEELFIHLW